MGREIKRVPLDFNWPLNKVWEGYLNPHYQKCPTCQGQGATSARQWLDGIVHLLLMAGESTISAHPLHPWLVALPVRPGTVPSPDMAELTGGLAGRPPREGILGHDAIDQWHATEKIVIAAGLDEKWGWCPTCQGEGIDPDHKAAYESWTKTEPPEGDGWQVWETVSEGSPMSPVFATCLKLIDWLVSQGYSRQAAEAFTEQGSVPSLVSVDGRLYSDIESAAIPNQEPT